MTASIANERSESPPSRHPRRPKPRPSAKKRISRLNANENTSAMRKTTGARRHVGSCLRAPVSFETSWRQRRMAICLVHNRARAPGRPARPSASRLRVQAFPLALRGRSGAFGHRFQGEFQFVVVEEFTRPVLTLGSQRLAKADEQTDRPTVRECRRARSSAKPSVAVQEDARLRADNTTAPISPIVRHRRLSGPTTHSN